jgi:hypothetical protein
MTMMQRVLMGIAYGVLTLLASFSVGLALGSVESEAYAHTSYVGNVVQEPVKADSHDERERVTLAPPCEYEDASGPHDTPFCRWDAPTAGLANGGQSFTAYRLSDNSTRYEYDNGTVDVAPSMFLAV